MAVFWCVRAFIKHACRVGLYFVEVQNFARATAVQNPVFCRLTHGQNCWYHWAVLTTITDERCTSFEEAVSALLQTVQRKIHEGLEINCDRSVSTCFAFLVIFCSRYFEKVPDVDTFLYLKTLLKLPYAILAGDLRLVILFANVLVFLLMCAS